ncbi:MAG: hypothetical protein ACR2PL_14335 [Dehalococcoidia bacterium]
METKETGSAKQPARPESRGKPEARVGEELSDEALEWVTGGIDPRAAVQNFSMFLNLAGPGS